MKKTTIFFIIFLLIISFTAAWVSYNKLRTKESFSDTKIISLNNVLPGKTTEQDLLNSLGQPLKTRGDNFGDLIYEYKSNSEYNPNEVYLNKNKTVSFVVEKLFKPNNFSYKNRAASIPTEPVVLYGNESFVGKNLYVFPDNGVAFLANKDNDFVFEVWYFSPSSINQLLLLPQFIGYSLTEQLRDYF